MDARMMIEKYTLWQTVREVIMACGVPFYFISLSEIN